VSNIRFIMGNSNSTADVAFSFSVRDGGDLRVSISDGSGSDHITGAQSSAVVSTGSWQPVAFTVDGSSL